MATKGKLFFQWDKDISADGYIVQRQVGVEFIELVRIENTNLTSITVPDITVGVENYFRVCFYKSQNKDYVVYKEENYYCFVGGRKESIIYRFPIPKLKKAVQTGNSITIQWEKVSDQVTYLVIRKTKKESWIRIGVTRETSFVDKNIDGNEKYTYTVRCVSKNGKTNLSGYYINGISV